MTRIVRNSRRSRTSCSILALATVLTVGATPAFAKGLNGVGTIATNNAGTSIVDTATTTTINLNPGNTVINWLPDDNAINNGTAINFQTAGTTATFTSGSNFAVLNNVQVADTSRVVNMSGTVHGVVGSNTGGSIYFYSPSGFLINSGAVFNVGSLVLSALPISNAQFANVGSTGYGTIQFGPAPAGSQATITMNGTVNAFVPPPVGVPIPGGKGYFAMIAPKVVHLGTATVDGSTALVGAEAATITFSADMLFDIQVDVGTTNSTGVGVYGNITGPTPTGVADQQRIMLVAVPKNDALTMVIGGGANLGFQLANTAVDNNGVIVLSAGHDVDNGNIAGESAAAGAAANFWFTGAHATSDLIGEATGYADLYSTDGQASQLTTIFNGDVTVHADDHVWMNASGAGTSLTVGGNLSLSTDQYADVSGGSATGGDTELYALNGGTLTVAGNAALSADGHGGNAESPAQAGGTGTGGKALVQAFDGGSLTVTGAVNATADGYGGSSLDGNGGAGFGGVQADGGGVFIGASAGTLNLNNSLDASASGFGGEGSSAGTASGNGTGGYASMFAFANGDISVAGNTSVDAEGIGGISFSGADGGDGTGGTINVNVTGTGSTLSLTGGVFSANGEGGGPGEGSCCVAIGGDGIGGLASVTGSGGGLIESDGTLEFSAAGRGGYGSVAGGNGFGGDDSTGDGAWIDAQSGLTINVTGDLRLDASGSGGEGEGQSGNGTGGYAALYMNGGTVSASADVNVDADGFGGDNNNGGNAGNGTGGFAQVVGGATSAITAGDRLLVEADGTGGESSSEATLGDGGVGTGGLAGIFANTGTLTVNGDVEISAYGEGGDSTYFYGGALGDGGDAFGGIARLTANGTGDVLITGALDMNSTATGGAGVNGGEATGLLSPSNNEGLPTGIGIYAITDASSVTVQGLATLDVSATGGDATTGSGGLAQGGEIDIIAEQGDIRLAHVDGTVDGTGGAGGFGGGNGGGGSGGNIDVAWSLNTGALNGSITIGSADLTASGYGGAGGEGTSGNTGGDGGAGGLGFGGNIFYVGNAAGGIFDAGATTLLLVGTGGAGGNGGSGSVGAGGNGGNGGDGTGGFVQTGNVSSEANSGSGGTTTYTTLIASTSASGGAGGSGGEGAGGTGIGGDGGNALAGAASFLARGIPVSADLVNLTASAQGGAGGSGSTQGDGGDAYTGILTVESKDRFGHTTERGLLTADAIFATASAQGGDGAVDGASFVRSGSSFRVTNGDTDIGSMTFNISGTQIYGAAGPDYIQVQDGNAQVGSFNFSTTGNLAIYTTSTGTLNVLGSLGLNAGNFIDHPTLVGPATPGTIFANSLLVTSGGDFIADANLDIDNGIDIAVPGAIRFDNATSAAHVDLWAQGGSIDVANVDTDGYATLIGQDSVSTVDIDAGGSVNLQALTGAILFGDMNAGGSVFMAAGTAITGGDVTATGGISGTATTGDIDLDKLTSTFGGVSLGAGNDINLAGDILADGDINLNADGLIDMQNATGGFFHAQAGGTVTALDLTSGSNIQIFAGDDVTLGDLDAGITADEFSNKAVRIDTGGSVLVGNITALGGIDITADGSVTGQNITTGDVLFTDADGAIHYGNISAGLVNPQPFTELASIGLNSGTSITVGNVESANLIAFLTSGTLTTGTLSSGTDVLGLVHGNITTGDITANGRVLLADSAMFTDAGGNIGNAGDNDVDPEAIFAATPVRTGGSITVGNVDAGSFTAAAGTNLTMGALNADGGISLDAGAAITTGNLNVGDFVLANGGSITTGTIDAFSVNMTSTAGNIATGDIDAFGAVSLDAFGDIVTGDILGGSIDLLAGDDITTGDLTTQFPLALFSLGDGGITTLSFPGASISLDAAGDISTGNIDSIDGVWAHAGGSLTTGTIDAVDFIELYSGGNMLTDDIDAGTYLYAESGGTMTLGDIDTGYDAELDSVGNMAFGNANTGDEFDFDSGASVNGGNIVAGNEITGGAAGTINLGTLDAGVALDNDFSIGIGAVGNITVGNATGAGAVGFASSGNLVTGNVSAGQVFMTLVGGNVTTGSITTAPVPGSEVYMADDSMFFANGGTINGAGDLDALAVLEQDPVATGGSITINGPVSTGLFRAAAGTGLTTQAITAGDIRASAGGTATINGIWNSSDEVDLTSNNIDITGTGGINAGGDVQLHSTNTSQVLIGDGLSGSGYALSNAEFGRIHGGSIAIIGGQGLGAAADTMIGDLTVTAGQNGNIRDADGGLAIVGLTEDGTERDGTMRVVGDVTGTGFTSANYLAFATQTFELDAATGSISLTSSGDTLGGELDLYADRIHVAEGTILDKLADNPTYFNYQQDLNKAATTQHPEGVLRADTLWIESENLADVLIQNTGSASTPAGFLVRQAFINDDFESAGPAGSINLVVNGQVQTEGGTVTGVAARDALVPEGTDIAPFTSNSTINGCPLTGECIIRPPAPPPQSNIVDSQIDLISGDALGDSDFGNEDSIDDNEEGDEGATNPIVPPQPLFDTRPLIPSGDVNDPVSGTGNPALLGSDAQCDEDEQGQCPNPVKGDSQ